MASHGWRSNKKKIKNKTTQSILNATFITALNMPLIG
jgi:hypothetical protein